MSHFDVDKLNELCFLIERRNFLQHNRQIFRSRVNYYKHILHLFSINPSHRDKIPKKYLKNKRSLLIKIKENKAKQLLAEVELHNYISETTKRVRKLGKELNLFQSACLGSNYINALICKDSCTVAGCSCQQSFRRKDIEERAENFIFETILLRNENAELGEI